MRTLTRFYRTFSKTFSKATGRFLLGYLLLHRLAVAIAVLAFSRIARDQLVRDAQAKMSTMTHMLAAQLDTSTVDWTIHGFLSRCKSWETTLVCVSP